MTFIAPLEIYMPPIEAYMALAEAIHIESDDCNASYVIPFAECACREVDIEQAVRILVLLRAGDWLLVRNPGTAEIGL